MQVMKIAKTVDKKQAPWYYKQVRRDGQTIKAAVAQSVERRIGSAEVTGPIPVSSSWKV